MSSPKTTAQWTITSLKGMEDFKFEKEVPIPELGEYDCLVQIKTVSLNYRDLIIPRGMYGFPLNLPVVAGSDAYGKVIATGSKVTLFKAGDGVCTLFNQKHQSGPHTAATIASGLGGGLDGTLRQYGAFPETGLVLAPSNATPEEAGTLTCAPLTAWNALYGLQSRALQPGDTVLTEGSGGVSLAAIQFAAAAGANVIATTGSGDKVEKLKKLGADHVINYKDDPNWGETAKKLSPGGAGVDHIIEVGGPKTMAQALKAVKYDGVITVIGFLGGFGDEKQPSTLEALLNCCIIRGVLVGSREQFEQMNRAIEANNIKSVVDEKIFEFENAKDAYQYMWEQKHFGNVVIRVSD